MKLQTFIRAAVCAAAIAMLIAGAIWFMIRPVAGRETERQTLHGAAALDRLKQDGQYDSLQAAMNQARFGVSRAENTPLGRAAWHAPNPAAGYDAYITEEGVSIALNDKTYVSLNLHSLGYGHALRSVAPGAVSGDRQTINITREDGVREWYVNGPKGLEHGFTLSEPPGVQSHSAPLRLALRVSKGWLAVAGEDGQRVILRGGGDQAVEYSKLVVRDSLGRNIPARLTVAEEQVVIEAEDSEATYPLTIDPIFTFQKKLQASDGAAGDKFGYAVALSENTAVIGAPEDDVTYSDQGSVYVFVRSGAVWTFQQNLTAWDGAASNLFGRAVALSGNTLVVGAPGSIVYSNSPPSAVYVFTLSGTVWSPQQKLTSSPNAYKDGFGCAVALSGDTLAVSAIGASGTGSIHVFTRNNAFWLPQQKLIANPSKLYDNFGGAVALSGDTLVAGATGEAPAQSGAAYIFTRQGVTWTQQQKIFAPDAAPGDVFGFAVAFSGDTLAVSAPNDTIGNNATQGSVHIYKRSGETWTWRQKITASDGGAGDFFGAAVALNGDTLVVGARHDTIGANQEQGSVYIFTFIGQWGAQRKHSDSDGEANDYFGNAVALYNGTLLVGAYLDNIDEKANQGSVHVFDSPPCSPLTFAPVSLPDGVSGTSYQQQITVSGGVGPYQFALAGGAPPPGLTMMTNGSLSGILPAPGVYQFTIWVTDLGTLCTASRAYSITIVPCPSITIWPETLPDGAMGSAYSQPLTATGGSAPYKFAAKKFALPSGLNLSQDGVLSGTPTTWGIFDFTVYVTDASGCGGSQDYTLSISFGGGGGGESSVAPRQRRQQ